jgi:hypothetical protein
MFLKQVRWAVLLACYVFVVRACSLSRITLPMNSFWRPGNLRKFRPYYIAPRGVFELRIPRR